MGGVAMRILGEKLGPVHPKPGQYDEDGYVHPMRLDPQIAGKFRRMIASRCGMDREPSQYEIRYIDPPSMAFNFEPAPLPTDLVESHRYCARFSPGEARPGVSRTFRSGRYSPWVVFYSPPS